MKEFDLVDWIRTQAGPPGPGVLLGIGDDAAVLAVPAGDQLIATTDTLHSGVHFHADDPPESVGHKALAVNLSDLAAMGATPRWVLLTLALPRGQAEWVQAFIGGFLGLARAFNVQLVGGDTSEGALSIGVTALGSARQGRFLRRAGAQAGDLVVVSGTLGDAALALRQLRLDQAPDPGALQRLHRPMPRLALGAALPGIASACIDISDGLLADLGHIAAASDCGAALEAHRLPASEVMGRWPLPGRYELQLTGGDDYELCFTLPPGRRACLDELSQSLGIPLTVVGHIREGSGVQCTGPDGSSLDFGSSGYTHKL
jgi:thiamine-monophosphate kinase